MNSVSFFSEGELRWWVDLLQSSPTEIKLPLIDERWYADVMSCVSVTQLHPDFRNSLHLAGASLFYKITKNHYRIDGNKRSAVITSYLFYIVNGRHLLPLADDLLEFARQLAESKKTYDETLPEVVKFLEMNTMVR